MDILGGLMDHQVLQRNKKNVSEVTLTGTCGTGGILQVQVTRNGRALPGLTRKTLARIKGGRFTAKLVGIPVGGPYEVTLKLLATTGTEEFRASDILVGDVWILAGQSNMQGVGLLTGAAKPKRMVRAFYMNDRWAVARDPLHVLCDAIDPVHHPDGVPHVPNTLTGTGPGVAFGQTMAELTGVPQGVIACAHGGTSMAHWNPVLRNQGGKSFYGATIRRFRKNGSHVAGVIWYQGCAEASADSVRGYTNRMKKLVSSFRRDLSNPKLPFVLAQIATVFPGVPLSPEVNRDWNAIQDQQRLLPTVIKHTATVPGVDLELDDCIHISGPDQNRLGRRLANATWTLMHGPKHGTLPITLKKINVADNLSTVELIYDNVVGKLRSPGKPAGFSILDRKSVTIPAIYRVDLKGNKVVLGTVMTPDTEEKYLSVAYGYGADAYCNITDEADRSLPVFAPQLIFKNPNPRTLVKTVRISKVLPGAGKLEKVKCPRTSDRNLGFTAQTFPDTFYNLHEVLQHKTDDAMVFYAASFSCEEPMQLQIGFGYDGPVKMWIDGEQVYHDPNGINPMLVDQFKVPYRAAKGRHEIIVAFSANFGQAWGISLRLYRTDLTKRQLKAGPEKYKLPKILD